MTSLLQFYAFRRRKKSAWSASAPACLPKELPLPWRAPTPAPRRAALCGLPFLPPTRPNRSTAWWKEFSGCCKTGRARLIFAGGQKFGGFSGRVNRFLDRNPGFQFFTAGSFQRQVQKLGAEQGIVFHRRIHFSRHHCFKGRPAGIVGDDLDLRAGFYSPLLQSPGWLPPPFHRCVNTTPGFSSRISSRNLP